MAEARHLKTAAEEAEKAAASFVPPGRTARQAIAKRKAFTGGATLPLPPKRQRWPPPTIDESRTRQRQNRDARTESRAKENETPTALLTAKAEARAEEKAALL